MKLFFLVLLMMHSIAQVYVIAQFQRQKNKSLAKQVAFSFAFLCVLLAAVYLFDWKIPFLVLILAVITNLIDSMFGYYLDFYSRSQTFDRYFHAFGTFSSSLFSYFLIINLTVPGGSKLFRAIFIFMLGLALGALYEIFEYFTDQIQRIHNQKGLKDTNFDLLFNLIGAVIAATLAYFKVL